MAPHDNSRFRSALETHNSRKGNQARNQLWSWKIKPLHVFSITLALILLAALFVSQFTNPTEIVKHMKTKRFVKMNDCFQESENVDTVQKDIHIIPEGQLNFAGRANRHPNHRYLEIDFKGNIYKKIIKNLYDESGWSPKPFDVKADERFMKVRNAISKKKLKGKTARNKFSNLKILEDSTGFGGVLGYSSSKANLANNPGTENFYEINNLIQNYSGREDENADTKKALKNHGAPFQAPVKDDQERQRLKSYEASSSKRKQLWFKERFEKRPLTIFLNIFPMVENHDYSKKDGPKLSHIVKPLRNEFSKGGGIHSFGKFLFPQEGRNGIIMKLNLYAKETKFPKRQNSIRQTEDAIHLNDRKRAEEKSFGWFSTKKKNNGDETMLSGGHQPSRETRDRQMAKWKR